MSSKLGLILSMLFVTMFFMFGSDVLGLQMAYSDLDAKSITISYLIAKQGIIDDDFISSISKKYNVSLKYTGAETPLFGEDVFFSISRTYNSLIISKEPMTLTVNRTAIIGYYG